VPGGGVLLGGRDFSAFSSNVLEGTVRWCE